MEVDVWDGPNKEPIVYHGHTLTSRILFKDVLASVAQYAFQVGTEKQCHWRTMSPQTGRSWSSEGQAHRQDTVSGNPWGPWSKFLLEVSDWCSSLLPVTL